MPFDPFATDLDLEAARTVLAQALSGADDGELFLERRRGESLMFDDGRLKNASYDSGEGFGLRVVSGEGVGYAHSDELSIAALKRAADAAAAIKSGAPAEYAEAPRATNRKLYGDESPLDGPSFAAKVALLREVDAYLREKDSRVVQATASLSGELQEVEILRADGHRIRDTRPLARINIAVIVEEGDRRESGSAGGGGRVPYDSLIDESNWKHLADEAHRKALVSLEAEDAPGGAMQVALGPAWCGVMLHEAVGHGLEGDFNRKGSSAFAGLMGEMVASKGVTVVDDGTIADRRGSISIDDEGEQSNCTTLIEDGKLVGYMQDRQNARLMGVNSTGNGRRQSYAHVPMPRMTNTYMLGGDAAPEDVVAAVKDGIYAVDFGGGQVDITNGKFVFSCTEAYRVKNGKILHPIKGATLIGDGPTAMKKVRMVANDMSLDNGIGMCGKQGQWVPVGVGQPTMLMDDIVVGGRGD